jgi:hypothetical protein
MLAEWQVSSNLGKRNLRREECLKEERLNAGAIKRTLIFLQSTTGAITLCSNVDNAQPDAHMIFFSRMPTYLPGDGTVELLVKGRTSPPVKVPELLIKSAFHGTPAKALRTFTILTRNQLN